MRVVVVGGYAPSLVALRGEMLRAMVANGHEVLAIAPEEVPQVRRELRAMGVAFETVPLRRAGLNPLRDAACLLALMQTFGRFRPDAVLAYAAKPVVYGSIAGRLTGVPLRAAMITGVGSALGGAAGLRRHVLSSLLRRLYAVSLRHVHVVFFHNPDDERLFRSLGLLRPGQRTVQIHGSGVDLVRFSPTSLSPPPITFLMICRLLRDKGVAEYAEAARRVRARHPETRVQLLGPLDPNPSAVSRQELEAWRREGALEYLGATDDVRPFIARAHVCVLPSYGEGMPRSVLEAMAMGRAIVTTDVPGCRETVDAELNGLLVPPRDAGALAEAMLRMVAAADRLDGMGRASRELAEQRFDVHAVNRRILDALGLGPSAPSPSRRASMSVEAA
jgi:glycosyltransferase involved in cell wall biosynthesis